jgi:hypothetical protein
MCALPRREEWVIEGDICCFCEVDAELVGEFSEVLLTELRRAPVWPRPIVNRQALDGATFEFLHCQWYGEAVIVQR